MPQTYVVQENEWLLSIATKFGFRDDKTILEANPRLKQVIGSNTDVLPPGYELVIPDRERKSEPAPVAVVSTFRAARKAKRLRLTIQRSDGSPAVAFESRLQ